MIVVTTIGLSLCYLIVGVGAAKAFLRWGESSRYDPHEDDAFAGAIVLFWPIPLASLVIVVPWYYAFEWVGRGLRVAGRKIRESDR